VRDSRSTGRWRRAFDGHRRSFDDATAECTAVVAAGGARRPARCGRAPAAAAADAASFP